MSIQEFASEGYQLHNHAVQRHLASLGLDLRNKSVLELGAGVGDHTQFWLDRSCNVLAVEGREENVIEFRKRFPQVQMTQFDLDSDYWPFDNYQIIYAYGVLYHLKDPIMSLNHWAAGCTELLLLETIVSNRARPHHAKEDPNDCRDGLCETAVHLPYAEIIKELQLLFEYVYVPERAPQHPEFIDDWANPPVGGYVRGVFIGTDIEQPNDKLRLVQR